MEKAFLQDRLTKNPFQDPMGSDAHQGLERWLDKFHQPTVPNYTIITDPEFFVFLWFHNAVGNLIDCPYLLDGYVSKLDKGQENSPPAIQYAKLNSPFKGKGGIQSGTQDTSLPDKCVDLTPFVRQATLPEIKPANGETIDTLFGKTTSGSFSPYASDGQQTITLQMVDTEFSILDSLFYPWMKDINSPWWYRPDKVYTEWATPYPMATLEVQRPRMRYRENPNAQQSRKDSEYTYYSYKYIGVKPTNYAAFEINGGGVSNLLRSLTLSCDMCLVDLTGDVAGSGSGSTNLGNRTGFIFSQSPNSGSGSQPDSPQNPEDEAPDPEEEMEREREYAEQVQREQEELEAQIEQQEQGDMPGEDEPEWRREEDDEYNRDEYSDGYGDGKEANCNMDFNEENFADDMINRLIASANGWRSGKQLRQEQQMDDHFDNEDWKDEPEGWEDEPEDFGDDESEEPNPNDDLSDYTMEYEAGLVQEYGEPDFTGEIQDGMMGVGSEYAEATDGEQGWTSDQGEGVGTDESMMDKAIGGAVDIAQSGMDLAVDVSDGVLDVAGTVAQKAVGAAGSIASAALDAFTPSSPQAQAQQSDQSPSGDQGQKQESGLLSTIGDALGNVLGKTWTAFGAVANATSASNGNSTTVGGIFDKALSSVFPASGNAVGNAANVMGGALSMMSGGQITQAQATGALSQMMQAKADVGSTSIMSTALNTAANGIASSTGMVGDVMKSVHNAGVGTQQTNSSNDFGALINRMTTSNSAKPTPLEGFVTMVTKQDAKGSTKAQGEI